jgi:hypothetical protein
VEAEFVITQGGDDGQVGRVMQQSCPDRHDEYAGSGDPSLAEHRVGDGVVEVEWLRVPTASELDHFVPLDHEGWPQRDVTWLDVLEVSHRAPDSSTHRGHAVSVTRPAIQRTRTLDWPMTDSVQIGKAVATWQRRELAIGQVATTLT